MHWWSHHRNVMRHPGASQNTMERETWVGSGLWPVELHRTFWGRGQMTWIQGSSRNWLGQAHLALWDWRTGDMAWPPHSVNAALLSKHLKNSCHELTQPPYSALKLQIKVELDSRHARRVQQGKWIWCKVTGSQGRIYSEESPAKCFVVFYVQEFSVIWRYFQ